MEKSVETTKTTKSPILTKTRSKRLKQVLTMLCTVLCMSVLCAMPVFASATALDVTVNSTSFMTNAETALKAVVTLLGGALGIWGIIQLVESYTSDNPAGRSSGMKMLAGGVGLIICAQSLVPAIFKMVTW